ncbi:MAG: prepilin-type N-terminal cleavage/methylation domain-containing protein [Clostridium sp.]|nr:prepilin-type N-terminal cleavage/methylation domain-containing protein [Clostridium sp.]
MKKKKGSTLIELIAAIAILAICMVGAYTAIASGNTMFSNDSIRTDMENENQIILETIRSREKDDNSTDYVKTLYDNYTTSGDSRKIYMFFDKNDLISNLNNNSSIFGWKSQYENGTQGMDDDLKEYKECSNARIDTENTNNPYGALIQIQLDTSTSPFSDNYYGTYKVTIITWKFDKIWNEDNIKHYESKTSFEIGR